MHHLLGTKYRWVVRLTPRPLYPQWRPVRTNQQTGWNSEQIIKSLQYISVPDTLRDFNFCCSFNWKCNTNGIFVLCNISWALNIGELLGSRLDLFIPSEGQFLRTNTLYETQIKSKNHYNTSQFQTLSQISLTAANVTPTETIYCASAPGRSIQVSC